MIKIRQFIIKHSDIFTFIGLGLLFYFIFLHNNWAYALMDVDESRYVTMSRDMFNSRDFFTLYLNGDYFFEKPPLYFWLECLSFGLFGKITEATARFPVSMCGILTCFATYFVGKKIVSRNFGVISSLILATSLEYVILSKFAILDIVLTTFIWLSLCFGILTQFCSEKNKKYCWWLFYVLSGLAVMAKGIPGFIIPFGSMFFITIYSKSFKEVFKPKYIIPGTILFLLTILPWHIIMLKLHGQLFFDEYIIKHHIARFIGEEFEMRQQPWYFFLLTLSWGFFPWIISVFCVLVRKLSKRDLKLINLTNYQRFIMYNGIIFLFTLIFFSISKTKLITYILPLFPSLACMGGYLWTNYVERGEYRLVFDKVNYILGSIFLLAFFAAIFTPFYLSADLNNIISIVKPLVLILTFFVGFGTILFTKLKKYIGVFFCIVIFMASLSAFGTEKIFEVDYKFGQDELMHYAEYADKHNKSITCYQFDSKYSLLFYSNESVEYGEEYDIEDLKRELNTPNNLVIVKCKNIDSKIKNLDINIIYKGKKYWLIEKK